MLGQKEKYLRMLRIELEDLRDHIHQLIRDYEERQARADVTEHVAQENVAVLRNEDLALRHFIRIVDSMDPAAPGTVDDLIVALQRRFDQEVCLSGLSRAACIFAARKMRRLNEYFHHELRELEETSDVHATAAAR